MCRLICVSVLAVIFALASAVESRADAPKIYRGADSAPTTASASIVRHPTPLPERPRPARQVVAGSGDLTASGNRLWMVDRTKGTITACRLVNTMNVGQSNIECFKRRLRGLKSREG